MRFSYLHVSVAVLALATGPAFAEYPERPVTVINPNSAGGGTDVGIRTWQPYVEACLGQGAVLLPTAMPGASGAVGFMELSKAAPDGYTVGMTNMPNLVSNYLAKPEQASYEQFDWIGNVVGVSSTFNVRSDSPFTSLAEAVDHIKTNGGMVNVAMGGVGADDHLLGLQFQNLLDVRFNFIPFGSGADSRNALLGGQVEFALMSNVDAAAFRNEIRALAVAANERSDLFPEVATFREQGYDLIGGSQHVIAAPKGTPVEVLDRWRDCVQKTAVDPAFLADAEKRSVSLMIMDAAETEAFVNGQAKLLGELWKTDPWIK